MNNFGELKIKNTVFSSPFIVSSCDIVSSYEGAKTIIENGKGKIGAIVWKTTTLEAREGYKEPIVCDFKKGFLVASGMKNQGIDKTIKEVCEFKEKYPTTILIVSIASLNSENLINEFKILTEKLIQTNIDGIELNLSCPHQNECDKFETNLIAQDKELVSKIVKTVSDIIINTNKFLVVKLTGWGADVAKIANIAELNGADAITVSNIFPGVGYYTGIEKKFNGYKYKVGESLLGNFKGGYTGEALLPAVLLIINSIKQVINIPIIATGGCMSSLDAIVQSFFSGASLIASSTFYYNINGKTCRKFGNELKKTSIALERYMKENNYKSVQDFHRSIK